MQGQAEIHFAYYPSSDLMMSIKVTLQGHFYWIKCPFQAICCYYFREFYYPRKFLISAEILVLLKVLSSEVSLVLFQPLL